MSVMESREIHFNHIRDGRRDTELRFDTSHFVLPCCTVRWPVVRIDPWPKRAYEGQ
jgi:hypothetical protein